MQKDTSMRSDSSLTVVSRPYRQKRSKRPIKATRGNARKKTRKGLTQWLKAVPEGAHGSGTLQKRLWRLKSDFVRIRDWTAFGTFIDTGEPIQDWNDAQAGHYRGYTTCNGMFKFHEMNIHAQSPKGNSWPTSETWENYRKNLVNRYNEEFVQAIDSSNKKWPLKITKELVLKEIHRTIKMLGMMNGQEKPPYYERMMKFYAETG